MHFRNESFWSRPGITHITSRHLIVVQSVCAWVRRGDPAQKNEPGEHVRPPLAPRRPSRATRHATPAAADADAVRPQERHEAPGGRSLPRRHPRPTLCLTSASRRVGGWTSPARRHWDHCKPNARRCPTWQQSRRETKASDNQSLPTFSRHLRQRTAPSLEKVSLTL